MHGDFKILFLSFNFMPFPVWLASFLAISAAAGASPLVYPTLAARHNSLEAHSKYPTAVYILTYRLCFCICVYVCIRNYIKEWEKDKVHTFFFLSGGTPNEAARRTSDQNFELNLAVIYLMLHRLSWRFFLLCNMFMR